jgi:cytochrome c553
MHYGAYDFSRNQEPTISPRQSGVTIGQREKLSETDIAEIRAYYKC